MIMITDLTATRHMKRSSRISFNQCGTEFCSPGHSSGPRVRYHCIIHFILDGRGKLIINHQIYDVHAGEAFLIPANAEGYYAADTKDPWKYFWLSFAGTEAENYASQIFGNGRFVKKISNIQTIWIMMKRIISTYSPEIILKDPNCFCSEDFHPYAAETLKESFQLNAGMYAILSMLLNECEKAGKEPEEKGYAERVKSYIDNYFMEISEIKELARLFHLHPNYLTAVFREEFYISPKQYLLDRKIEYANHLLSETDYPVHYISSACGFSSISTFGKIYKRHMGISPGTYRSLNQSIMAVHP